MIMTFISFKCESTPTKHVSTLTCSYLSEKMPLRYHSFVYNYFIIHIYRTFIDLKLPFNDLYCDYSLLNDLHKNLNFIDMCLYMKKLI